MSNGEKSRVTILAATKMSDGICIAGIDSDNKWFRPIPKGAYNFSPSLLMSEERIVVAPYNVVEFLKSKRLERPPHSEDVEVDSSTSPKLIGTLNDVQLHGLMKQIDEHDSIPQGVLNLENWLVSEKRSLILTRVDEAIDAYRNDYREDTLDQRRVSFRVGTVIFNLPCPDLRWRSLTRGNRDKEALVVLKSAKVLYLALGLSRLLPATGRHHAMVVGVHPIPRLVSVVDYAKP